MSLPLSRIFDPLLLGDSEAEVVARKILVT
jgi:hypothetical protein